MNQYTSKRVLTTLQKIDYTTFGAGTSLGLYGIITEQPTMFILGGINLIISTIANNLENTIKTQ